MAIRSRLARGREWVWRVRQGSGCRRVPSGCLLVSWRRPQETGWRSAAAHFGWRLASQKGAAGSCWRAGSDAWPRAAKQRFPGFLEASTEHKKHYRTLRGDLRNGCKWALGLWTWTWADAVAAGVRQQSQDVAQAGSADRRCAAGRCRAGLPCGVGQHGHVAPVAKRQGSVVRPPHGQKMSVVAGPRGAKKNAPPAGVPAARRVHQRRTRDLPISIGPASSDARRRSP